MIATKKHNPVIITLAVAALLLFLHWIGFLRGPENLLFSLVQPSAGRLYNWSTSLSRSFYENQEVDVLQEEISSLKKQLAEMTFANSKFQETVEENNKLKKIIKFQEDNQIQAVTASIIAKEAASEDSHDLVINRGAWDGVSNGLGVVSEEGLIVGKVIETKDRSARICLVTSPNCRLAAAVQNQNKTQGLTDGDLGLTIRMSYISQLEEISPADLVITSGLDGNIPRGLVIGRVVRVINEGNEVWQEATIEPLLDLNSLTIVSVIIP